MKVRFYIGKDGAIEFIHSDAVDTSKLSPSVDCVTIQRASHVEPIQSGANKNKFVADLSPVGGPVLGPFDLRSEALSAELLELDKMFQSGTINRQINLERKEQSL
jgi:hypothetical protein